MKPPETDNPDRVRRAVVRSLAFGLIAAGLAFAGALPWADALIVDHMMRVRAEKDPDRRIKVVGITDQDLQKYGQWPWPRARHAELIRKIAAAKPAVIMWDMVFAEPSHLGTADDAQLEAAMKQAGSLIMPITMDSVQQSSDPLGGIVRGPGFLEVSRGLTSLAAFNAKAASVGHVFFAPEVGGIVRSYVPLLRAGGKPYLAMPLLAAARVAGIKLEGALDSATPLLRALNVSPDPAGNVAINYLGKSQSAFEILAYSDVLEGEVPPDAFEDRVVLVGGAAVALSDSKTTPFETMFGLEILAHATSNLLDGSVLKRPGPVAGALYALSAALLAGLVIGLLGPLLGTLATAGALYGYWRLALHVFGAQSRALPIAPAFAGAIFANVGVAYQLLVALMKRRREDTEARQRVEQALADAAADFDAKRLTLGFERLAAIPEQVGPTGARVRALRLRGLMLKPEELELETFLDKEDLPGLPHEELLAAAGELEERARYDLAEKVLLAIKTKSAGKALDPAVEDAVERVASLKKKAGLASPLLPLARRVLGDEYQKVVFLGVGGMGFVVKALWLKHDRWVAVKFLSPTFVQHKDIRERFERETRILSGLRHPHIIEVLASSLGEQPYYSMEFFQGRTLGEVMQARKVLSLKETAAIIVPTAKALAYAHTANLVHRDVKPGNVLIGPDGTVKLTDFGIAKSFELPDLTPTGEMLGTPDYMSPEQVQGENKRISYLTDVYALGVLVYEMLTGATPFPRGAHPFMRVSVPPQPVTEHGVDLPEPVVKLIMTALATETADRTVSCEDFVYALEAFQ